MVRYIQGKDGKFAGSIGDGKDQVPTAGVSAGSSLVSVSPEHGVDLSAVGTKFGSKPSAVRPDAPRPMKEGVFAGLRRRKAAVVAGAGAAAILSMGLTGCSSQAGADDYVAACVQQSDQTVVDDSNCDPNDVGAASNASATSTSTHSGSNAMFMWYYLRASQVTDVGIGQRVPDGYSKTKPVLGADEGIFTAGKGRVVVASSGIGETEAGHIKGYSSGGFHAGSIGEGGFHAGGFGGHAGEAGG